MALRNLLALALVGASAAAAPPSPLRFLGFIDVNKLPFSGTPLSYNVYPDNYFDAIPADQRSVHRFANDTMQPPCARMVTPDEMAKYEFQTETLLSTLGLNIYDGAIRTIALMLVNQQKMSQKYISDVLLAHKTVDFADIRGDAACKGIKYDGACSDPQSAGVCGFCYGDNPATQTQNADHAYFFRMITDHYGIEGTVDQRCPERNQIWTWNDYTPVLGENSWAALISPMQVAYHVAGGDVNKIADDSAEMKLAVQMLPVLEAMKVGSTGAFYYTPRNTYFFNEPNMGSTVSTENQGSLLAGLKMLYHVINTKAASVHKPLLPQIKGYVDGLNKYLISAWDPTTQYFRQGGTFDPKTGTFEWVQGDAPKFAVDCQTWVATAMGTQMIDDAFGAQTAYNLWQKVKDVAGYKKVGTQVSGVGFTDKAVAGEVFSGEWTFGAINWLRVMAEESTYPEELKANLRADADYMRAAIETELTVNHPTQKGAVSNVGVLYANRRYYIPFGWWANNIQSMAATSWAVAVDSNFNPLALGGKMSATYPDI